MALRWDGGKRGTGVTLDTNDTRALWGSSTGSAILSPFAWDTTKGGAYYFEVLMGVIASTMAGVAKVGININAHIGVSVSGWGYLNLGYMKHNNVQTGLLNDSYVDTDIIGVAVKAGKIYWAKNGVWQNSSDPVAETGAQYSNVTGVLVPATSANTGARATIQAVNTYSPPTGYDPWPAVDFLIPEKYRAQTPVQRPIPHRHLNL